MIASLDLDTFTLYYTRWSGEKKEKDKNEPKANFFTFGCGLVTRD